MTMTRPIVLILMLLLAACSAPRVQNTRLGSADLVAMTDAMAASLLMSPVIAERTPASPRMVIVMDRITNRSDQYLPRSEQWLFMNRLRALLNQRDALRGRNMVFVLSKQQAEVLGERHEADVVADRTTPTHALAATLYSATQVTRATRSDMYLAAFNLIDLQSQDVLWEDTYEVKYAVDRDRLD